MESGSAASEWKASWPLPLVSAIGYAAGIAYLYSLGVFIEPLEQEFGWSRVQVTSGLTIVSALFVFLAPFTGLFIDRWGARRVALPGMVFYSAALAGLSLAGSSIWSWWALWIFVGLGALCVQAAVWTAAVASRFDRSRGLAMAITLCGAGLGSAITPIIGQYFIAELGWRGAYVAIGITYAALSLPLIFFFFYDAADKAAASGESSTRDRSKLPGLGMRESLLSSRFIRIAVISLAVVTAMTALLVHAVPMLVAGGLDRATAAAAAGFIGIGSIAGRLTGGLLLDRISGALVGGVAFSLPILVCLLLTQYEGSTAPAFMIAFLLGLSLGGEVDVLAYLTSRYFGLRNFGTLFAIVVALQTLALGIGPLIAGYIYDLYGTYEPLLFGLIPVFVVATLIVATLGRYPTPEVLEAGKEPAGKEPA